MGWARLMFWVATCLALAVPPAQAGRADEIALARSLLHDLQARSIRTSREYCGLIGRRGDGGLVVLAARRGSRARCRYPQAPEGLRIVASYHTHGSYLRRYDNEVPSVMDVLMDIQFGTTGFVSTPGGRFWMIDSRARRVTLLCGARCLPWDPRHDDRATGLIAPSYTLEELHARQR
ncbi:MAG: DUF4329 domain-containing protein [Rhodobacteraceae bacterium]|nr:DUF4329 domain-containing protein [Paracoccaceae bacterium]